MDSIYFCLIDLASMIEVQSFRPNSKSVGVSFKTDRILKRVPICGYPHCRFKTGELQASVLKSLSFKKQSMLRNLQITTRETLSNNTVMETNSELAIAFVRFELSSYLVSLSTFDSTTLLNRIRRLTIKIWFSSIQISANKRILSSFLSVGRF